MDDEMLVRQFDDLHLRVDETVDGLTVEALVVPYGREIQAVDLTPDGVRCYREMFTRGSCARAVKAPNRVSLTYLHDETFGATLGYGAQFREDEEGLTGRFRLYESTAPKARDVLGSSHRSVSVGFTSLNPRAGSEREGALVVRSAVIVRHAAAVPEGQYAEARILAMRARDEMTAQEAPGATESPEQPQPVPEPQGVVEAAAAALEQVRWLEWADEVQQQQEALRQRFA
jgi:HK97 family phage prohead protease